MKSLAEEFVENIFNLCGEFNRDNEIKDHAANLEEAFKEKDKNSSFGYRQLNEVLLLCNKKIISQEFFEFIAGGENSIQYREFANCIEKFHKLAMLQFGSFRFAYEYLRRKEDIKIEFGGWIKESKSLVEEYKAREKSIRKIKSIEEARLSWLGYLSLEKVNSEELDSVRKKGESNFETYLTYDYLDVYVATSMREDFEYVAVNRLCREVFGDKKLSDINIRYFDPTLNYHKNSIAKALIEGLMLKRAKCTVYLVQEADTMGKDSEMASTLAQGKPVIAYVPEINVKKRIEMLKNETLGAFGYKIKFLSDIVDDEEGKSKFDEFKEWFASIISSSSQRKKEEALRKDEDKFLNLIETIANYEKKFYDKRANTLRYKHPLRFQIDLTTGVANGVLVARTPDVCAELIYNVLTNSLKFEIYPPGKSISSQEEQDDLNYRLVETKSKCAFRVVTRNEKLTNSFWNLYLEDDSNVKERSSKF